VLQDRRAKLAEVRTMMSFQDSDTTVATAARVGADLREARERLGWSLPAIAAHLRIRLPFLEAIEDGRIRDLPGNAYAVGFVRAYAQSLGLDPDEISRRFRNEAADINRKTELTFPVPVPERGVPAGAVVLLGALLAIGAYVGWYHMSGNGQPSVDAVQPVPTRLAPLAETVPHAVSAGAASTLSPSSSASADMTPSQAAPGQLAQTQAGPAQAGDAPAGTTLPMPGFAPGSASAMPSVVAPSLSSSSPNTAAQIPVPGGSPSQLATTSSPTATSPAAVAPVVPAADGGRIVLRASADAWVQVRDRQGSILLNRVMRAGETWQVPAKGQLTLTTGNAGGTELLVDGVATPSLGADGAVRRDLALDPDAIRDGKLAVPVAAKSAPKQP
jgi:cytoskeleton protein RodZ